MAWQSMAGTEPKCHALNSRNKDMVHNCVLILPNCVIFGIMVPGFYLEYAVFLMPNVMLGVN